MTEAKSKSQEKHQDNMAEQQRAKKKSHEGKENHDQSIRMK